MKTPVVSMINVTKTYEDHTAVNDLNLDIFPGEFLTLLGPSGCGKTTVLRLIAGLESCNSGEINIGGVPSQDMPANQRNVNTVFQSYALFPHLTVFENIAFGLKLKKMDRETIRQKVEEALETVKLPGYGNRKVDRLSGGQQQRVAIARAIVNKPLILLLDEPLSALDYKLRKDMRMELKRLHRKLGITFVFVTHDQEEALTLSDRIIVMRNGNIEQQGPPTKIYEEPVNLFVADFVGECNLFDGKVINTQGKRMSVSMEGETIELENTKNFSTGESIHVILRPEDMKIMRHKDECPSHYFPGKVEDMIYKGTTVDIVIRLESGKEILVSEFFNEDAEDIHYTRGEKICVTWFDGWEVTLPYE